MAEYLVLFLTIMVAHWVSDFVLQTHWMATNKSRDWKAMLSHVTVYTGSMMFLVLSLGFMLAPFAAANDLTNAVILVLSPTVYVAWILLNGFLHLVTDIITSRYTSRLWAKADYHNFFVMVGFDQLIHYTCLFVTIAIMWNL